jgi:hypothetical protein
MSRDWKERPDLVIAISAFVLSMVILMILSFVGWSRWGPLP